MRYKSPILACSQMGTSLRIRQGFLGGGPRHTYYMNQSTQTVATNMDMDIIGATQIIKVPKPSRFALFGSGLPFISQS